MKTILLSLAALCCLTGCSNQDANLNTTRKIFEAFNAHDWHTMLSHYADSAVFEDPEFVLPVQGRTTMEKHHRELHATFPNIHDAIRTITAAQNKVIVEFTATGTAPNGEQFSRPICAILTFRDGKVIHDATYYYNCPQ